MNLTNLKENDLFIIKISGKLDSKTSPDFESHLMSVINSGEKKILLDCDELDYISSAGLRVLLIGAKILKNSGGQIVLSSLKEHIAQVFEISGFVSLFPIFASKDEAVRSIG